MSVVIIPVGPMYVKKTDARAFIATIHRNTAIVALFYACFILGFQWLLDYEIKSRAFILQNQPQTILVWTYSFAAILVAGYLFLTKPDYGEMNTRIKRYSSEQMIKTGLIVGTYYQKITVALFIGITFSLIAIIWPIYSTISNML